MHAHPVVLDKTWTSLQMHLDSGAAEVATNKCDVFFLTIQSGDAQ